MNSAPILVIINNKESRDLAVELLEYAGYETVEAATAADGLRMVKQHLPRAIILDVFWLPDFDGLQLMRVLQGHAQTQPIPVIALAAMDDWYELEGAGFSGNVDNPIDLDAFSTTIAQVVGDPKLCDRELG